MYDDEPREPLAWEKVEWRQGDGRYVFEVAQGGLHATFSSPHGRSLTLPVIAWDALLDALTAARRTRARTVDPHLPSRSGARWTRAESDEVAAAFKTGATIDALARTHNRTPMAIEAQLASLGLWHRSVGEPIRGGGRSRPMVPPDWPPDPPPPTPSRR